MAKPAGPACNYACSYCYYTGKKSLFSKPVHFRMDDALLERFTRDYIAAQPGPEVIFSWQGGEPTLLGRRFYERALALQERYRPRSWRIRNALQTHGGLLDKDWAVFLRERGFLVGLSIDGPRDLHDRGRHDRRGRPTFARTRHAISLLRQHGVEFNSLTVVHAGNWDRGAIIYRFLRNTGVRHMQFIPLVERLGQAGGLAGPPSPGTRADNGSLSPWTAPGGGYGHFLLAVLAEWRKKDIGRVYVQMFDQLLGQYLGHPPGLCVFSETCGHAPVLEHNGDLFSCDHYVYPRYRLGNIAETPLGSLVGDSRQLKFGMNKRDLLPSDCLSCQHQRFCNGGCPKHRFAPATDGTSRLNYLCPSYRMFFAGAAPLMTHMSDNLLSGQPAATAVKSKNTLISHLTRKKN